MALVFYRSLKIEGGNSVLVLLLGNLQGGEKLSKIHLKPYFENIKPPCFEIIRGKLRKWGSAGGGGGGLKRKTWPGVVSEVWGGNTC